MSSVLQRNSKVCLNGHPETERIWAGGRMRCPDCIREQRERRRAKEKAGLVPTSRQRKKMPVCPKGCIQVCLCEEL